MVQRRRQSTNRPGTEEVKAAAFLLAMGDARSRHSASWNDFGIDKLLMGQRYCGITVTRASSAHTSLTSRFGFVALNSPESVIGLEVMVCEKRLTAYAPTDGASSSSPEQLVLRPAFIFHCCKM